MKLIIDIPEDTAKEIKDNAMFAESIASQIKWDVTSAIVNGIPLDDVKAEIDKAQEPYITNTAYDEGVRFGLMLAYQIVDRCKAESEDKE